MAAPGAEMTRGLSWWPVQGPRAPAQHRPRFPADGWHLLGRHAALPRPRPADRRARRDDLQDRQLAFFVGERPSRASMSFITISAAAGGFRSAGARCSPVKLLMSPSARSTCSSTLRSSASWSTDEAASASLCLRRTGADGPSAGHRGAAAGCLVRPVDFIFPGRTTAQSSNWAVHHHPDGRVDLRLTKASPPEVAYTSRQWLRRSGRP